MPYIIKYQSGGMDKYSYDITTLEQVKSKLQKIGEGDKAVRYNHLSFNDFSNQQPNGFRLSQEALSYYFGDSTPVPNAEVGLEEEIVPEQSNAAKKKSHLLFVILLSIACIVGGIAIVYSKQKKDARNARAQTRAVQAAGFDITGTYTKKEIHEITDAINHGNGTITMDEFNNILSRKTREKMCSNGDIKVFPRLAGLGGTASAGSTNSSSRPEPAVFRNAQSVLPYLIGKEFRSKDGSMRVRVSTQGISFNGKPLTNAPVVDYVERSYAVIHAYSPLRNATYRLGVYPQDGYIVDLNDDKVYYCR